MNIFGIEIAGFVSLTVSAGLVSVIAGWGLQTFVAYLDRRRRANFLLLQLSVMFQAYSSERHRAYAQHKYHEDTGGHAGKPIGSLAELPTFPDMPDVWPLIDTKLSDRVLQFNILVAQRSTTAGYYLDTVGELNFDQILLDHLEMGYKAIILSQDLRYSAGLMQFEEHRTLAEAFPPLLHKARSKNITFEHP